MVSQPRRFAILSIAVSMLAIGLECTRAEECDYKTCGALMARDGLVSWAVSGRRDYSPDHEAGMCGAQCLRTSREKQLGRTSGGGTRARFKLIEIESKKFSNRLCCANSS
jgi:hypothetical protein